MKSRTVQLSGQPRIEESDPRQLPRPAWHKNMAVTVYHIWARAELAYAAIVYDAGGRGDSVPLNELQFEPVAKNASVEYLKKRKAVV